MSAGRQDYVEVIRQLPKPSVAQTERFARFVSSAHSWYKHLPVHPKVPFVFYLDPGAGMSLVQTRTGESALVEIADESTRFHYTWQKTPDYRRRFGYWNYHAAYATSFWYASDGGVVNTAGPGLRILAESGDWVPVPPDLAATGTALISALVHPHLNFQIWGQNPDRFGFGEVADPNDTGMPPSAHLVLRRLWSLLQQESLTHPDPSEVRQAIPRAALEFIERLRATKQLRSKLLLSMEQDWEWPSESWLEQLQASGVEAGLISSVVKYTEIEILRSLRVRMYRPPKSLEWPHEASVRVVEAIFKERGRQLAAMTDAMSHFVEAVYSS
jgi:hypothetical protein